MYRFIQPVDGYFLVWLYDEINRSVTQVPIFPVVIRFCLTRFCADSIKFSEKSRSVRF